MDCRDLSHDRLAEPASAAVRAHLERCDACRDRQAELRSLGDDLAALGRALPRAENPALVRRILARIPKSAEPSKGAWRWAAGFAAAAALLFVMILATRKTPAVPQPEVVTLPAPAPVEPLPPAPLPAPTPQDPTPAPVPPAPASVPNPPSPEAPTLTPTPKPVAPEPPAPRPVETPKVAPPETKPVRVALMLTNLEGALEMQDGAAWKKLVKSADWDAADPIRSGDKMARFTLPEGTRATLRPHSEVRLQIGRAHV